VTIWKGDFTFVVAGVPYVTTADEAKALDDAIVQLYWDHLDVGYFAANDVADLIEVSYLSRLDVSWLARRPLELTVESEWIPRVTGDARRRPGRGSSWAPGAP
jgi:hypothetical protein